MAYYGHRYRNQTFATVLMRQLYQSYDAGGHSGRSTKSQLLESALFLQKIPKYQPRITLTFLESLRDLANIRKERQGSSELLLFPQLEHLSNEEYSSLIIWYVREQNRLHWDEVSFIEKGLIETIALLLGTEELARQSGVLYEPEALIREGHRRRGRLHKDQYYE